MQKKIIQPFSQELIKTNLFLAIPPDQYGRIGGRSGLALKHGIGVVAGVIDSNFRGLIAVILFNHSRSPYEVNMGYHVAQMMFKKYETVKFVEWTDCEKLPKTERVFKGIISNVKNLEKYFLRSFLKKI